MPNLKTVSVFSSFLAIEIYISKYFVAILFPKKQHKHDFVSKREGFLILSDPSCCFFTGGAVRKASS